MARAVQLKDKQRVTLRFTATTTGSYGLGLMRLTVDGQGGARIVRESVLQVQPARRRAPGPPPASEPG